MKSSILIEQSYLPRANPRTKKNKTYLIIFRCLLNLSQMDVERRVKEKKKKKRKKRELKEIVRNEKESRK